MNNKIQTAKIAIFLTSIFVIFLSVTYAFINVTINGITVGNLDIDLEEDDNFTIDNTLPVYDEVGCLVNRLIFA